MTTVPMSAALDVMGATEALTAPQMRSLNATADMSVNSWAKRRIKARAIRVSTVAQKSELECSKHLRLTRCWSSRGSRFAVTEAIQAASKRTFQGHSNRKFHSSTSVDRIRIRWAMARCIERLFQVTHRAPRDRTSLEYLACCQP